MLSARSVLSRFTQRLRTLAIADKPLLGPSLSLLRGSDAHKPLSSDLEITGTRIHLLLGSFTIEHEVDAVFFVLMYSGPGRPADGAEPGARVAERDALESTTTGRSVI